MKRIFSDETRHKMSIAARKRAKRDMIPITERFWSKVDKSGECWEWRGHKSTAGYGRFFTGSRIDGSCGDVQAHRWSFEEVNGEISEGLQLDHLCRNRACVRPSHLEPVTPKENYLRGISPMANKARQTHCIRGHAFDEENTYIHAGRRRQCRICRRDANQKVYDKKCIAKAEIRERSHER